MMANYWANVTLVEIKGECGTCPATPAKGQTVLIPPCVWAEGCRAVVPIANVTTYEPAKMAISQQYGGAQVFLPVLDSGQYVGPGDTAYVLPCTSRCCGDDF
jgi:hypothetical protein